jgi:DMSO/TMAO reductase YedYZ molybdopterin-dependent catalytic subunit
MIKKLLAPTFIIIILITLAYNPNATFTKAQTTPTLTINGLVETPQNLTLNQITAMPQTTVKAAIICVDAPTTVLENGNWVGVKLSTLLQLAGISPNAVKVGFFASDGYSSDLSIQTAIQDDIILAYQKDGQALSGYRLVAPGMWGYKWINQVTSITVFDYNYLGHWESLGYSDTADIASESTQSRIPTQQQPTPILSPAPNSTITPSPTATPSPSPSPTLKAIPGTLSEPTPTQKPQETSNPWTLYAAAIVVSAIVIASLAAFSYVRKKR